MSYKYPLATATWDQAEYDAIQSVISSGMFTMGPKVFEFERQFASYLGSRHCVMVNSGSSANLLMVAALFYSNNPDLLLKPGDEVIVPAVSWSTTYYPLHQYGLKIKFVDIDLQTLNYDLNALEKSVTDNTRLIMSVNLLGNPNDFDRIQSIIGKRKIILIEDNCESLGAEFQGKKAGTLEGGVISTDDDELHHILLSLRAHGWTRNLPQVNHVCGEKSDDPFKEYFRFVLPGYNLRPLEMSGAVGVQQIIKLPSLIAERRKNGNLLQNVMQDHPKVLIQKEIGASSWFGFSLVIRPGVNLTRAELLIKLNKLGFEVRPIVAGNFAKNDVVKYFNSECSGDLSNADHIDNHGLFVGNHHYSIKNAIRQLKSI